MEPFDEFPQAGAGGCTGGQSPGSGDFEGYWWYSNGSPGEAGDWYENSAASSWSTLALIGGMGGASFMGGAGSSGGWGSASEGQSGAGGGGGCAYAETEFYGASISGAGGGAGAYLEATIYNPSGSYEWYVGEGGAAGGRGSAINVYNTCAGTSGGNGTIILELYFH